jgi:hypothetical protein
MFLTVLALFDVFSDISLILKLLLLVTIIAFIRQHLGDSILSMLVIAVIAYFVLFVGWGIFGSIYFIYLLLMAGIAGMFVDFFFVLPSIKAHEQARKHPGDETSGKDIMERGHKIGERMRLPVFRPPPPMG